MKFVRFILLAVVCSFIAAGVRVLVFGRPQASAQVQVAQVVPGVPNSAQDSAFEDKLTQLAPSSRKSDQENQAHQEDQAEPLQVIGYVKRGHRINLWLSDGRFLTERDKELTEVRKNYALIDGQRVWFKPPVGTGPNVAKAPQPQPATRSEAERGVPL